MSVAEKIAAEIKRRAGGRVRVDQGPPEYARLTWLYDCPCGEVSGFSVMIEDVRGALIDDADFIHYHVATALEVMRRHVRSEGNEPSF